MRLGWLIAAAAMVCAVPAGAVKAFVEPTRPAQSLSGGTETCLLPLSRQECSLAAPRLLSQLGAFEVDLPSLDGRFRLGPITYTTPEQDYFYLTPSFRFENGILANALIEFTYSARRTTDLSITNVFVSGLFTNGMVTIAETGEVMRGVPEPATWAMMVLGFATLGVRMRRRREQGTVTPHSFT